MSEFNLDLAEKVLNQITLHPDLHIQASPRHCVLGWSVELGRVRRSYGSTESQAAEALGIDYHTAGDNLGDVQ